MNRDDLKIPEDQMTPLERATAYLAGKEVDRLPCQPRMLEACASYAGENISEYYFDADIMARSEIFKVRGLNFETAGASLSLRGIGEALGSKMVYPTNRTAHVESGILQDYSMLDHMDLLNPYQDGRCPIVLEAVGKIKDELDGYCAVGSNVPGPISAAHAVRGEKQILRDMIKEPENFHKLMDFMVANTLAFVKAMYDTNGAYCSISDPMCSTVLINPKKFREMVYPYLDQLINGMVDITGRKPSLHICGRTKEIWPEIKQLNISAYSLDNLEDMAEAKAAFGDKVVIEGNVDPVSIITNGTVADVFESVHACIQKAGDSPHGYIVSSGCSIQEGVPIENLKAISAATRYYSQGAKIGKKYV